MSTSITNPHEGLHQMSPAHSPAETVATELRRIVSAINEAYPTLCDPFDPDWRSPCETGEPRPAADSGSGSGSYSGLEVPWRPLARQASAADFLFEPLERALERKVHDDIKTYYASFYSGGLEADSADGPVSLLQLWNDADTERLIENLLGHFLAQTRSKSPFSVFFALTEVDSEMFLTVENNTGHVLLERPGYRPVRTVANSLAEFLAGLRPAPPERHPERAAFLRAHGLN